MSTEGMIIFVRCHEMENPFPIHVTPTDTIENVKQKIQQKKKIPIEQQHLIKLEYGEVLPNDRTLSDYLVQNESTLDLLISQKEKITIIFVTNDTSKEAMILDISLNDTVQNVKDKIQHQKGISSANQILEFEGDQLHDEKTLSYCKVENKSFLHLSVKENKANNISDNNNDMKDNNNNDMKVVSRGEDYDVIDTISHILNRYHKFIENINDKNENEYPNMHNAFQLNHGLRDDYDNVD
eukprot:512518_1